MARGLGRGSQFPDEEAQREKLANGREVMPKPHFSQPDNGTQAVGSGTLGVHYDITKTRVKSGNVETDISGGLF